MCPVNRLNTVSGDYALPARDIGQSHVPPLPVWLQAANGTESGRNAVTTRISECAACNMPVQVTRVCRHAVPSRSYLPLRVSDAQRMQRTQGTASCLPKLCTNMRRLAPEAAAFLRALSDQGFCGLGEAAKLAHAGTLCTFISFSSLESCHCSFAIPATQLETRKL